MMGAPIPPLQLLVHTGEMVIPRGFGTTEILGTRWTQEEIIRFQDKWNETLRRGQNHRLTCQTEAVQTRCAYCQTLHLTTAAVRCSSCGAPR